LVVNKAQRELRLCSFGTPRSSGRLHAAVRNADALPVELREREAVESLVMALLEAAQAKREGQQH